MRPFQICGACLLTLGVWTLAGEATSTPRASKAAAEAAPLESPDSATCFDWKYPDKDACGSLKGKTECKAKPSIEGSDDAAKKEECKPTKGEECFCD
jgi:hypothetical protein